MAFKELRVAPGKKFRLSEHDPRYTADLESKDEATKRLVQAVGRLRELQSRLYAEDRWAVLLIFQAMDAAGKDSTIARVMSGVNPAGCQVYSFKAPSAEELDHDFLWRTSRCLPERGRIGVFNRSYYEEVLIVRVHPEILSAQRLPPELVSKRIWEQRYQDINGFERYLSRNGTLILKFFLHVSKGEQRRRFLARLDEPEKNWKFSVRDVDERARWNDYQQAYQDMIQATSTDHAPWYVVPADHKWFTRVAVAEIVAGAMERLRLRYPELDEAKRAELQTARKLLEK